MEQPWILFLYALLLIDSIGAMLLAWFGRKWWYNTTGSFAKYFPPAKGWTVYYFVLVLVIGYLLGIF